MNDDERVHTGATTRTDRSVRRCDAVSGYHYRSNLLNHALPVPVTHIRVLSRVRFYRGTMQQRTVA